MARTRAPATHCVHRWAHNTDPHKTGRTGNRRYDGMSYYLYATVMAVKYPKQGVVVVAGDGVRDSITTSTERSRIFNALPPDLHAIYVDCDEYGHRLESVAGIRKCHDAMKKKLRQLADDVRKARLGASQAMVHERFTTYRFECNEVAKFLKRKQITNADCFSISEIIAVSESRNRHAEQVRVRSERNLAKRQAAAAAYEKRLQELALTEAADAELWRRHEYKGQRTYWNGTYLRLSRDGAHVETSKGVVVPFADALRLFRICTLCRKRATELQTGFQPDAPRVGIYSVGNITDTGDCRVGCHSLKYDEMARCFETAKQRQLVSAEEGVEA